MPCPEKFMDSMQEFHISEEITQEIFDGYHGISGKSPKKTKAAFFKRAIDILEQRVPHDTVCALLEWNACCKSGARDKASREFARINAGLPIEEKLAKIRKAPYMNMGAPWLCEDGTIKIDAVSYIYEGKYACACSNYRRVARDYPVSKTYCCCCAGHFQYHYELMLGLKLALQEIVSSPLDSDGQEPCVMRFGIV